MTDCNPIEQQARQDQLEALYEADGRDNPEHPLHCLYSGLVAGQIEQLAAPVLGDYREAWDMSSKDGSLCFASAILSRLVGMDAADEADVQWLAAYLQANVPQRHPTTCRCRR